MSQFGELGGWGTGERAAPWEFPIGPNELSPLLVPHEIVPLGHGREIDCIGDGEHARERFESQGHNAYGFEGTCGLASVAGVGREFGLAVTENDVVRMALERGECSVTGNPFTSGGTSFYEQRALLETIGIPAHCEITQSLEQVVQHAERGEGVILNVNAGTLWNDPSAFGTGAANHAVTVTGLRFELDKNTGQHRLMGFEINDTGRPDGARNFVAADTMQRAALVPGGTLVATDVSRWA